MTITDAQYPPVYGSRESKCKQVNSELRFQNAKPTLQVQANIHLRKFLMHISNVAVGGTEETKHNLYDNLLVF